MNPQMVRTLVFVGVAAVCVAGAIATSTVTKPPRLDDTAQVGEPFFPEFSDPAKATSLRVAAYDAGAAQKKVFSVEYKDNLWRIPSHHNYPADAADQLAKTASSVVGISRGAYSGKSADDHKRLGVLDPLDDTLTGTEGRGKRITLSEGNNTLVDLIVGEQVEGAENTYYVRRADEQRVYRARLDSLNLTTKFADWIEQDLLKVQSFNVTDVTIDRYHVDEQRGTIVEEEKNHLTKVGSEWKLEGLNEEDEKVKTSAVSSLTYALQDMKIVGVRPKPAGLTAALRRESGGGLSQLDELQMQAAGFYLTRDGALKSNEGELIAGTNEGVKYTLRFGEVFSGSDLEIEVGTDKKEASEKDAGAKTDADGGEAADADPAAGGDAAAPEGQGEAASDEPNKDESGSGSSLTKRRYVFITADFDESLLGPRPVAPVKPEPPAEGTSDAAESAPAEAPAGENKPEAAAPAGDAATSEDSPDAGAAAEKGADEAPADNQPAEAEGDAKEAGAEKEAGEADEAPADNQPAEVAGDAREAGAETDAGEAQEKPAETKPDPKAEYEAALRKYEQDQADFETKTREFDEKVEKGKKLANDLNLRFAAWYYVIDADQFDKLRLSRADLVEPKNPPGTPGAGLTAPGAATIPGDDAPSTQPEAAKPEGEAGTEDKPAESDKPADADNSADGDKPADSGDQPGEKPEGEATPEKSASETPAGDAPEVEGKDADDAPEAEAAGNP